jgi:hypothetical protein
MLPLDRFAYPVAVTDNQGRQLFQFSFVDEVFPDRNNLLELDDMQVFIPYNTVPDRLHLQIARSASPGPASAAYEVGSLSDPVIRPFVVSFRPPPGVDPAALVVVRRTRGAWSMAGKRATADGRIYAHVSEFGTYALAADYEQPWIKPVNFTEGKIIDTRTQSLVLRAGDDLSGLDRDVVAFYLNGEWIPALYDYKRDTFTWDMKEQRPLPGPASLDVVLADQCGNTRRVSYKLIF